MLSTTDRLVVNLIPLAAGLKLITELPSSLNPSNLVYRVVSNVSDGRIL